MLKYFDDDLLDKLFGFCYARTNDSYEAEELCSDIVCALVKAAQTGGEIESVYSFIWKVARNVYADFSNKRKKYTETIYEGDSEEILLGIAAEEDYSDDTACINTSGRWNRSRRLLDECGKMKSRKNFLHVYIFLL